MRGTKSNLNPVQKTNEKFQNATSSQKVGRKADYAKSKSLVPELTEISTVQICGPNECVE